MKRNYQNTPAVLAGFFFLSAVISGCGPSPQEIQQQAEQMKKDERLAWEQKVAATCVKFGQTVRQTDDRDGEKRSALLLELGIKPTNVQATRRDFEAFYANVEMNQANQHCVRVLLTELPAAIAVQSNKEGPK